MLRAWGESGRASFSGCSHQLLRGFSFARWLSRTLLDDGDDCRAIDDLDLNPVAAHQESQSAIERVGLLATKVRQVAVTTSTLTRNDWSLICKAMNNVRESPIVIRKGREFGRHH